MENCIPVISRKSCGILPLKDILYANFNYRRAEIHTCTDTIVVYEMKDDIEERLSQYFNHSLKGLYINFDRVVRMSCGDIIFDNGDRLGIGHNNYARIRGDYIVYLKNIKNRLQKKTTYSILS